MVMAISQPNAAIQTGKFRSPKKVGFTFAPLRNLILMVSCLIFSTPLFMLFFGSFKTPKDADKVWLIFPQGKWQMGNYAEVLNKAPIIRSAMN
jgi:ABC-type glycerol-3-phosphate transport system permease component